MPFRANCPACGAPVAFRSSASFHAVCEFCRSTLVRQDGKLENLGRMADLVEDASPLRLGSEGRYQGTHFAIIGRIQLRYAAGVWNEWHLLFDDQRTGWLSDAAGEYVVSFLTPPRAELPSLESLAPEDALTLAGREFVVTDIEQATCVAGEGELPFSFGAGYPAPLVDLRTRDGAAASFATIDYSETPPLFFVGQSLPFAAFAFTGLREADAAARPAAVAALQCPACGGPIAIHDKAVLSVACPSCLTVLDAQDPKLRVLQKAAAALRVEPAIALGSVGRFGGREWTVIGFQQRAIVPGDGPPWQEYLLHHPQEGFRWLVEAQGHWNWVSPLAKLPVHRPGAPTATLGGESFRRFSAGKAETRFVIGEFTWTVSVGETWDTTDFIAPPRMLSREANGNEVTWSVGDYLPPAEVAAAFGIKDPLPTPTGIGMNQPNPRIDGHRTTCGNFWRFAGLALLAQLLWVFVLGGHSLLDQRLVFSPRAEEPLTTRAFRLDGGARARRAPRHRPRQQLARPGPDPDREGKRQGLGFADRDRLLARLRRRRKLERGRALARAELPRPAARHLLSGDRPGAFRRESRRGRRPRACRPQPGGMEQFLLPADLPCAAADVQPLPRRRLRGRSLERCRLPLQRRRNGHR